MMMMVSNSGNRFKQLRLDANKTVEQAARELDIKTRTLYAVEEGKKPGIKLLVKMCRVYNTSLKEMFQKE